ncbi:MAG: hypothetical protein QM755_23100 [Luteolibacter sp.]
MPAYYLEALTVALGIILLMAEAFSSKRSKAWVGGAAAIGLGLLRGPLLRSRTGIQTGRDLGEMAAVEFL